MKLINGLFLVIFCSSFICSESNSTMEKVVDLLILERSGETIEFPFLYDELIHKIPEKSSLKSAKYLESLGFEKISGGRGNYPPRGPRIVSLTYQKDDCKCETSLIYYATNTSDAYERAERVKCYE